MAISIPGARDPNSGDVLDRGLTADEWAALQAELVSASKNPANIGARWFEVSASIQNAARQRASERLAVLQQRQEEETRRNTERETARGEREKMRTELLAKIPELRQRLGDDLMAQQTASYEKLNPIIEQRLNALGLLQSGALPEAQAKAQKELEMARQSRLGDFELGARQKLELGLPLDNLEEDLGSAKENYLADIELDRAGMSREFSLSDAFRQENYEREQEYRALEEARRDRRSRMNEAWLGAGAQLGSSLIGAGARAYGGK